MLPVALLPSLTLGSRIGTAPPVHPTSQGLQNLNVALTQAKEALDGCSSRKRSLPEKGIAIRRGNKVDYQLDTSAFKSIVR